MSRRREVVLAGHRGDAAVARAALTDPAADVRVLALGACSRLEVLSDGDVRVAMSDTDASVRRRAVELAASRPAIDLRTMLDDPDPTVVEQAAWSCGEQGGEHGPEEGHATETVLTRLVELATAADVALVREAAVAALGAIGDVRGLPAILAGCRDQPAVRRRAVLALAPFEGPDVDAALDAAMADRDWQVRQAAQDLRRAARD